MNVSRTGQTCAENKLHRVFMNFINSSRSFLIDLICSGSLVLMVLKLFWFTRIHSDSLGFTRIHSDSLGFTRIHSDSLEFLGQYLSENRRFSRDWSLKLSRHKIRTRHILSTKSRKNDKPIRNFIIQKRTKIHWLLSLQSINMACDLILVTNLCKSYVWWSYKFAIKKYFANEYMFSSRPKVTLDHQESHFFGIEFGSRRYNVRVLLILSI
jgi:hypothetical protein